LAYKLSRLGLAIGWVCAALLCAAPVHAQSYELAPWPVGKAVPAFDGVDLTGKVWHLADLRGKAVLINFWASWCPPCLAEMPSLATLAQVVGPEQLVVLTVNFKESAATAQRFVARTALTLPVLRDPDGLIARQWGANVFPTTVLLDAQGRVKQLVRGEVDWTGREAEALLTPLFKR
jgi:thiol-disulfide isomerase/thioredoxin